jgi:5-methylcytosine-specific restriction enzyme A
MKKSRFPSRRLNLRKSEKEIGHLRGPHGYRLCRYCGTEVQPPRKTFCSDECVHFWKLRSNTHYLRQHIYVRDCGVCIRCGLDTRLLKIELEDMRAELLHELGGDWEESDVWATFLKDKHLTKKEAWKSLWHADHVVEVADGGGSCDMSNIQSLCLTCHKQKTAKLRALRKENSLKIQR